MRLQGLPLLLILAASSLAFAKPKAIEIPLHVLVQKGSSWNRELVSERLLQARKFFATCQVDLNPRQIIFADVPALQQDRANRYKEDHLIGQLNPNPGAIFVVFSEQWNPSPRLTGYAWPQSFVEQHRNLIQNPEALKNLLFVFAQSIQDEKDQSFYKALIHELGHVLLDSPGIHAPGNFLSHTYDGMQISKTQCAQIRLNASRFLPH